jgi:iron complex outermembrane receptor protein
MPAPDAGQQPFYTEESEMKFATTTKFSKKNIVLVLAALFPLAVHAADEAASTLPELTVTATRDIKPQASYAVDLQSGRAGSARDSAAMLEGAPGAAVSRNGSQTGIVQLRGLSGDRVNVQVDGMHITPACPNHMDPPMHYITADGMSSLEVIAGIAPVRQGGDSIAGSVIAQSAAPHFGSGDSMELFGKVGASYSGANDGSALLLRAGTANQNTSIAYTGEKQVGKDLRFPGGTVKDSGYELVRHDLSLAGKTGNGTLRLDLGRHESRDVGTPTLPMDMIRDDADKIALGYSGQYSFGEVEAKIYRHEITHMMDNYSLRPVVAPAMPMLAPATSKDNGYLLNTTLPRGSNTYRLGMEYLSNDFDSYSQSSTLNPATLKDIIRNGKRNRLGVYGEWEANAGEQWRTLLGLRSDTVSSNADEVVHLGMMPPPPVVADAAAFNAGQRDLTDHNYDVVAQARYRASESGDYELALARKTRSPNLVERYLWTPSNASAGLADGRTYLGDLALKPEVSSQISVGANWHAEGWQIKPSLFYNRVDDYIQGVALARTDSSGNPVLQYSNIEAELYGMDGSWQYRATDRLNLSGTVSYVRGKRTDVSDNLYRLAPLRASVNGEYATGKWTHRAEWLLAASQDKVSVYNAEEESAGYATVNLRTRYQMLQSFNVSAGIENLFDKYYADHLGGINRVAGSDVLVGKHIPGAGRFGYVAMDYTF